MAESRTHHTTDGEEPGSKTGHKILVTGATGYIGGRLVPALLEAHHQVVCFAREPRKVAQRSWAQSPDIELVQGDAADQSALETAMADCDAAYYLIHSMEAAGAAYRKRDRDLARTFAAAAQCAGVRRIIYLGGLGETGDGLSEHLASRREVEEALASGTVPVTVLRAAMIIGSGSASFEILRYLVERLPIMITPRWVSTESQPIAVRNVIHYLVACLAEPRTVGRTIDIGGADVMTYRDIMQVTAEALGLRRRWIVPVPVLTPRLSSLWIHLVTPLSHRIARPLADGLKNRVVCRDNVAIDLMPQRLLTVREAIDAALGKRRGEGVASTWADAGPIPGDPDWAGGRTFEDRRTTHVHATADEVFRAVCGLGGRNGYFAANGLWRLRGWMDRLVGGPGLRRGRRDPQVLGFGDALDFWRVTGIEPGRSLNLRAEMKLPGEAMLSFEIEPSPDARSCDLVQTARFKPRGLFGLAYWYAVVPLHHIVFNGMLQGIRRAAEDSHITAGDPNARPPRERAADLSTVSNDNTKSEAV